MTTRVRIAMVSAPPRATRRRRRGPRAARIGKTTTGISCKLPAGASTAPHHLLFTLNNQVFPRARDRDRRLRATSPNPGADARRARVRVIRGSKVRVFLFITQTHRRRDPRSRIEYHANAISRTPIL